MNPSMHALVVACTLVLFLPPALPARSQTAAELQSARGLLADGDAAGAATLLEAVPPGGMTPRGYYVLGLARQDLLRHERAVAAFERADSLDARAAAALARSLDQLGRTDEAVRHYRRAVRLGTEDGRADAGAAASLARLLAEAEKWDEVAVIYARLLAADPENSLLHAQLGTAYLALDSVAAAVVHLERAHRLNPQNVRAALHLTRVYIDLEQFVSARRVAEAALDEAPRNPKLWQRRGDIALREGDYRLATDAFERAMAYGDSTAVNHHNRGVSLYMRGRFDEALPDFEHAWALDTTHVMNAFYLGVTLQQVGRYDDALAMLAATTKLAGQPVLADVHTQIAATHDLKDDDASAIASYRLALDLAPSKREILFHLAKLYDTYYADPQMALKQYERFLARVAEGELPEEAAYARQRVAAIREATFFEEGRQKEVAVTPADSAGQR